MEENVCKDIELVFLEVILKEFLDKIFNNVIEVLWEIKFNGKFL